MNRLVLLPISTSDDGNGLKLRDEEDENGDDTRIRLQGCIEATTQADRLVAVRDAAVKWVRLARFAEREGHAMGPSNRALVAAVEELESTRAETEPTNA